MISPNANQARPYGHTNLHEKGKTKMKKLIAMLLALMMIMSLSTTAFAQTVDSDDGGSASITIENASKGETYKIVKIFDATVTGTENGSIAYTGEIPEALASVFTKDSAGNISVAEGVTDEAVVTAVTAWANTAIATAEATSDGTTLTFTGLQYGYYAVLSSQGAVVTIDSTNPNATVYDKNTKEPTLSKTVNDSDVDIGQTVTYTVKATTANYLGEGANAEIVTQYVITDTLPAFLSDVTVTSITIGGAEYKVDGAVPQFNSNNQITIPWAEKDTDGHYASLYANGAEIVITYTAKVTAQATIDGAGNKNEVTLTPYTTPDDSTPPDPWEKSWKDDEIIYTYAAALQKVDENKKPLAGAKFAAMGLTVEKVSDGVYRVVSYDSSSTEYGTEMETDAQGQLVILGLSTDSKLTVKETAAPAGYNKLVDTTTMTPVKTGEEIKATETTIYYDANGNVTDQETSISYTKTTYNVNLLKTAIVVINQAGTELPSTGGMGTTMFYVFGAILMIGAAVLLVTKKRMASAE